MKLSSKLLVTAIASLSFVGAASAAPVTVSFQQGVNGYTGAVDTSLESDNANAVLNNQLLLTVQGNAFFQSLFRFDDIIGPGVGQIDAGSTVTSATLSLEVTNPSTAGVVAFAMLVGWDENTLTYNNAKLGGDPNPGISAGLGIEARAPQEVTISSVPTGTLVLDLTSLVQEWVDGSLANNGIVLGPNSGSFDGVQIHSSEYSILADRPELTVTFESTAVPAPGALALLGLGLIGLGARRRAT